MIFCWHKFVDGFGMMGDAVVCVKCGFCLYIPIRLFPVIKNDDGLFGSRQEPPYVVKFRHPINLGTDWDSWTHYFDARGKLIARGVLPTKSWKRNNRGLSAREEAQFQRWVDQRSKDKAMTDSVSQMERRRIF
jgi:hypothetical protein